MSEQPFISATGQKSKESFDKKLTEKKKSNRKRDIEAVYDEDARREFITGFRKRKQQRREVAMRKIEEKKRKDRIQERRMNREAINQRIEEMKNASRSMDAFMDSGDENSEENDSEGSEDEGEENHGPAKEVLEFETATVTVEELGSTPAPTAPAPAKKSSVKSTDTNLIEDAIRKPLRAASLKNKKKNGKSVKYGKGSGQGKGKAKGSGQGRGKGKGQKRR
eukprot:Rmarinus@m.29050